MIVAPSVGDNELTMLTKVNVGLGGAAPQIGQTYFSILSQQNKLMGGPGASVGDNEFSLLAKNALLASQSVSVGDSVTRLYAKLLAAKGGTPLPSDSEFWLIAQSVGSSGAVKQPPAVVQGVFHQLSGSNVTTSAVAYAAAVTAGNALIAFVDWFDITSTISSVKDNVNGINWTNAGTLQRGNGYSCAIYFFNGTLAGTPTVTLTLNQISSFLEVAIIEVSNLNGVVDGHSSNTGTNNAPNPGAITTSVANCFIVSAFATASFSVAGAGAPWVYTLLSGSGSGFEYQTGATAASYNGTFTSNASAAWCVNQAAFQPK